MDRDHYVKVTEDDLVSPVEFKIYCSRCRYLSKNKACVSPDGIKKPLNVCWEPSEEFTKKSKEIDAKINKEFTEEISESSSKKLTLHIGWRSYEDMKKEQDLIFDDLFERFKRGIIRPAFRSFIEKNNKMLKSIMKIFYYSLISGAYE